MDTNIENQQAKPRITLAYLDELFSKLAVGSVEEVTYAKKEVNRLRYQRHDIGHKKIEKFLSAQIARVEAVYDQKNRAAILQGIAFLGFEAGRYCFHEVCALVLRELAHADGAVREAARRLGECISPSDFMLERTKGKITEYQNFLKQLGGFIIAHRGASTELHIEKLKPSAYKSAVLLWDRLIQRGIDEKWVTNEEEKRVSAPRHEYDDPTWIEDPDNELDIEALKEHIWHERKHGDPQEACHALERLHTGARDRLHVELQKIEYPKEQELELYCVFDAQGPEYGEYALTKIMSFAMGERGYTHTALSALVRALQGYVNHLVLPNTSGEKISPLLVHAFASREEQYRKVPKDFAALMSLLDEAHEAIDAYRAHVEEALNTELHGVQKVAKKYGEQSIIQGEMKYHEDNLCQIKEAQSIAHHVLDWAVQSEPWGVCSRTAQQLAAIAWHIVMRYNQEEARPRRWLTHVSNRDLAAFGGWKGASISSPYLLYNAVVSNVLDPELLLLPLSDIDKEFDGEEMGQSSVVVPSNQSPEVKEVEQQLLGLLIQVGSQYDVEDVKRIIYNETETADFHDLIRIFDDGDPMTLSNALEVLNDAWNVFPHKILSDKSPNQMLQEHKETKKTQER